MSADDAPKPPPSPEAEKPPLIVYPAVYPFKVMGKQEHGFREYVRLLFSRLMGSEVSLDSLSEAPSNKNTYVSITVSVVLLSEEQRRMIYEALYKEKRIVYYM